MTSLASARSRRRWIAAIVAANLAGLTAVSLTVAGPARADAAPQHPALQGFAPALKASASAPPGTGQAASAPSGGYLYRNGRYTALNSFDGLLTADAAVNDRGETAGSYVTAANQIRGFLRDAKGNFTTFDGSSSSGVTTDGLAINDEGDVAGVYGVIGGTANGFVRSPDGKITTIDVPGASGTYIYDVNDSGAAAGFYLDAQGLKHGFLYQHGAVTTIDPPGVSAAHDTTATDINNRGQIVGYYADAKGTYHGYLYDHGRFTLIDPPHAANVATFATTAPFGINDGGQVVGQYIDSKSVLHGYLWQPGRGFTTVNAPQIVSFNRGVTGSGTIASDITGQGQVLLPPAGDIFAARVVPVGG